QSMQHEPCRLGSNTDQSLNLARADPVLGRGNQHHDLKPVGNGELGAVEDRSGEYRELPTALGALPHPADAAFPLGTGTTPTLGFRGEEVGAGVAAVRTPHAFIDVVAFRDRLRLGPAQLLQERV